MRNGLRIFLIVVWLLPAIVFAQEKRDSIPPLRIDSIKITLQDEDALNPEYPKLSLPSTDVLSLSLFPRTLDSTSRVKFSEEDLFDYNLYLNDYSVSGALWHNNKQAIIGSGSFTTLPFLGAVSSANISYLQRVNGDFQYSIGVDAYKYAFGSFSGNQFGLSGSMRYRLNDNLALNAFGVYYLDNPYYSHATLPFIPSSYYGASMSWDITDGFGADLGAQRYFDSYSGRWETIPIVMPYVNVNGAKIGIDFGGFIKQGLENIFNKDNMNMQVGPGGNPLPKGAAPLPPMRPMGR